MKFKRNIAMAVKQGQTVSVPNDEVWAVSIFESKENIASVRGSSAGGIARTGVRFGGGTKFNISVDAYVTGIAFTAD